MVSIKHRGHRLAAVAVATCLALVVGTVTAPVAAGSALSTSAASTAQWRDRDANADPVLLFAASGAMTSLAISVRRELALRWPDFTDCSWNKLCPSRERNQLRKICAACG